MAAPRLVARRGATLLALLLAFALVFPPLVCERVRLTHSGTHAIEADARTHPGLNPAERLRTV